MSAGMTCQNCGQVITRSAARRVERLGKEYDSIKQRGYCIACFWQRQFEKRAAQITGKGEKLL